jgi:peptidyl-prolyl cis-trans isomerase SurA
MKKHYEKILYAYGYKNLLAILILAAAGINLQAQSYSPLILEKVIAQVSGEYIFYSDVQELYGYALAQNPEYEASLQCDILEQLIVKKLLIDQAEIDSIMVSDIEVEAQVQQRLDYILSQMGGDEERFFQYYGQTIQEKREEMRAPLKEELIQERIQRQLISDVDITPKEVVSFFKKIPVDSLPFLPAEVELGEITTKTRISAKVKKIAFDKIERVRNRIVNDGESFEELASIFSDDTGSAVNGGELGWAKRGSYVPEFEAAGYGLVKGEVSEIIETQFGYHFLELIDRRGNNIQLRHILVKPEITPEDIADTKSFLDSIKILIEVDSLPFVLAVKLHSDEDAQSYSNGGRMSNPESGDTFWETGQLPYQIYFAIENLDVNDMSDIIELEEREEKVFKIVQLQNKSKPHRASLETDFAKIKEFAKESKKNEYFNNWMDMKIMNTAVKVKSDFKNCPNIQAKFIQDRA